MTPRPSFQFQLASDLGGMTVDEMCARMSNAEFVKWIVFYKRRHQREELALQKAKVGR